VILGGLTLDMRLIGALYGIRKTRLVAGHTCETAPIGNYAQLIMAVGLS
jgi:hypothetical protein